LFVFFFFFFFFLSGQVSHLPLFALPKASPTGELVLQKLPRPDNQIRVPFFLFFLPDTDGVEVLPLTVRRFEAFLSFPTYRSVSSPSYSRDRPPAQPDPSENLVPISPSRDSCNPLPSGRSITCKASSTIIFFSSSRQRATLTYYVSDEDYLLSLSFRAFEPLLFVLPAPFALARLTHPTSPTTLFSDSLLLSEYSPGFLPSRGFRVSISSSVIATNLAFLSAPRLE